MPDDAARMAARLDSKSSDAGIGEAWPELTAFRNAVRHCDCPLSCDLKFMARNPGHEYPCIVRKLSNWMTELVLKTSMRSFGNSRLPFAR